MNVIHTAVWVTDLDETKAFYMDALGLVHSRDFVGDDGATNYFVRGETDTELQFKHDPDGNGAVEPAGIDHLAVGVDDLGATFDRVVEETGCPVIRGPRFDDETGVGTAFIEDPDGYALELIEWAD